LTSLALTRGRVGGAPWLLLALAALVTAAVLLSPAYLILRAAESSDTIWSALTAETTLRALYRTIWLTFTVTLACILIAVPAAWLTLRTDLPLRSFWTVTLALPLAIPSFVGGFITVSALGPGGMLQDVLSPLGVERLPSLYGFKGAWLTLTFLSYPYVYLTVRAALRRADPALEEAARSLGKPPWHTFLHVNLPQLRPGIAAGALLLSLYVLSEFGAVSMLRYDTLTPIVYIQYTSSFDRSAAAVLGLPLIFLTVAFLAIESLTRSRARYHTTSQPRPARMLRLGAWRWPALLFCSFVSFIGIGMPVVVVLYWLFKGLDSGESTAFLSEAVINSARASVFAAGLAVIASLPIALLSVHHRGPVSSAFEKLAYLGQSLPGITIALALVFFSANFLTPLYQTIMLLVFAYAIRFLPEALGATRAAMLQVNPHTEEAARSLGAGPLRVFGWVTAPQILPGMSAGALLVFLTAMKELPITLLLSPIGFDTLATQVWSSTTQAFFTEAALPALLLIAVSAVAVLLLLRREPEQQHGRVDDAATVPPQLQ
jgi:iron(III) transport system permease protein